MHSLVSKNYSGLRLCMLLGLIRIRVLASLLSEELGERAVAIKKSRVFVRMASRFNFS